MIDKKRLKEESISISSSSIKTIWIEKKIDSNKQKRIKRQSNNNKNIYEGGGWWVGDCK